MGAKPEKKKKKKGKKKENQKPVSTENDFWIWWTNFKKSVHISPHWFVTLSKLLYVSKYFIPAT